MKSLTCILLLLICCLSIEATHIVGGNIHYEHLGDGNYLIQLYVYRDCATSLTDFDDPAAVGVFDENGNLIQNIEIPISDAVISDVPVNTYNPCLSPPEGICVKEAIYSAEVNLPPVNGGYTLAYQRCCRNTTLVNTESNDDLGSTFYAEIPGIEQTDDNSNPQFNEYPPVVICLNQPFVFDHSATDIDGDELVYEFCNPLLTNEPGFYINPPGAPPYPELEFYPEYDYEYPIDSDPAFAIDPVTGELTGTPTMIGQFVVGICVSEYRNGELIATMNRDFQFNVVICDVEVIASIPDQEVECDGLTINFQNNSVNAEWYFWDFGVDGIESDTSNLENPVFTFPDYGEYTIMLIANPGLTCSDTAYTTYIAAPEASPDILPPIYECIDDQSTWSFAFDGELEPGSSIDWDFGSGASPSSSDDQDTGPIEFDSGLGDIIVTLTISIDDCEITQEVPLFIPTEPEAIIEPQETFCGGFTYIFGNNSTNAETYYWDFGWSDTAEDESTEFEPETTFPEDGTYYVDLIVTAENTCPDETTVAFEIYSELAPYYYPPDPQCLAFNTFDFEAFGAITTEADYSWDFESGNPLSGNGQTIGGISWSQAGWFDVTLTISDNGCEESFTDSIWVIDSPILEIGEIYKEGCAPLTVHFEDLSVSDAPLIYEWDFGDGNTNDLPDPSHIYENPGTFDVTLTITTALGCAIELTETIEQAVYVFPHPTAYFDLEPIHVTLTNPTITLTDLSWGSVDCWYNMSDGGTFDGCNGEYDWTEPGHQLAVQYVINEWGCIDSIGHIVIVEGFTLYAPNSFTPDQDGVNDVWLPIMSGIMDYHVQIYNRWGEVIFETRDQSEPWLGNVKGGDHYAQDGIYTYRIVAKDYLYDPHVWVGHVSLLR